MPAFRRLVLRRYADIGILVALLRVVGDSEKFNLARLPPLRIGVARGHADIGAGVRRPAKVDRCAAVVKPAVGQSIARVETRIIAEVVELAVRASQGGIVAKLAEVARIKAVGKLRQRGQSAPRGQ